MLKFLSVAIISLLSFQDGDLRREVVKYFDNGQERIVVYYSEEEEAYVKEEVFFSDGQCNYYGHYRNKVEHGEWKYFYKNGQVMSVEYYHDGLEHGKMYDYDEKGNITVAYEYNMGKLIEKKEFDYSSDSSDTSQ